jgi:DNA polymerase IV
MSTISESPYPAERTILHIDMDAFFASVEQVVNPNLKAKPIIVCGSHTRTVVLTASYEARDFGVRTGMTRPEAKRLCPNLICVPAHNDRYADTCRQLLQIYERYTPLVEVFSVDEAFLDLTGSGRLFGGDEAVAKMIKAAVAKRFGLSCSIGIAPNRLLAKLASGLKKPDGLVILKPYDIPPLLEDLPTRELCGIGPRLEKRLAALNIRTCGQLGRATAELLTHHFGVIGSRLRQMGQGLDSTPVIPTNQAPEAKSIGHSMTLDRDLSDSREIESVLFHLAEMVGRRARRENYLGYGITVIVRYADFETFSRQASLPSPSQDGLEIFQAARKVLRRTRLEQPIRLLGVSLSRLLKDPEQGTLFGNPKRRLGLLQAMDAINDRYGDFTLTWATLRERLSKSGRHPGVISPAWRPQGTRNYG